MAVTNLERVGKAMELLRQGLAPFVERELRSHFGTRFHDNAAGSVGDDRMASRKLVDWDVAALLKVMWETWNDVFRSTLGQSERTLVSELRDARTGGLTRRTSRPTMPIAPSTRQAACSPPCRLRRPTKSRR